MKEAVVEEEAVVVTVAARHLEQIAELLAQSPRERHQHRLAAPRQVQIRLLADLQTLADARRDLGLRARSQRRVRTTICVVVVAVAVQEGEEEAGEERGAVRLRVHQRT